jgi:hypothetical protein
VVLLPSITITFLLQDNLIRGNNPINNKLDLNKDNKINKEDILKDKGSLNKDSRIKVILNKEGFRTNRDNSLNKAAFLNKEVFLNKEAILNKGDSRIKEDILSKDSEETPNRDSEDILNKGSIKEDFPNKAILNKDLEAIPNKEDSNKDSAEMEVILKTGSLKTTSTKCNVL